MPPAALICSTANCTPWFSALAAEDRGPGSDENQPMRIGPLSAAKAVVPQAPHCEGFCTFLGLVIFTDEILIAMVEIFYDTHRNEYRRQTAWTASTSRSLV